eukprot:m.14859 g.14859  ORF g.14859 m.14859 type:complete len:343 (-) comp4379_c0_seq1:102-1130(-)
MLSRIPRWLAPLVVLLGLVVVISTLHMVYVNVLFPEIGRSLRFPPLTPDATPYPPIPFFEDLQVLSSFFSDSMDDVTEDVFKFTCVSGTFAVGYSFGGGDFSNVRGKVVGYVATLTLYPVCDYVSDGIADKVSNTLRYLRSRLGFPTREPQETVHSSMYTVAVLADNIAEDTFKIICLWSHAMVGQLLGENLLVKALGRTPPFALKAVIMLGVPAAKYNLCNQYGDFVGDWVEYHLDHILASLLATSTQKRAPSIPPPPPPHASFGLPYSNSETTEEGDSKAHRSDKEVVQSDCELEAELRETHQHIQFLIQEAVRRRRETQTKNQPHVQSVVVDDRDAGDL